MHSYQLISLTIFTLLGANPASALKPRDSNLYALETAPEVLARISSFRAEHAATLTPTQSDFLDDTEATVTAFDLHRAKHLKETCPQVFNEDECSYLLTGKHVSVEEAMDGAGSDLGKRKRECACSTESDWCGDRIGPIWACEMGGGDEGCDSPGVWCGTLGFWYCNGICMPTCSIPCS